MLMETPTSIRRFAPAVVCAIVNVEPSPPVNSAEPELAESTATWARVDVAAQNSNPKIKRGADERCKSGLKLLTFRANFPATDCALAARRSIQPPTPLNL